MTCSRSVHWSGQESNFLVIKEKPSLSGSFDRHEQRHDIAGRRTMAKEEYFSDVLQDLHKTRKNGALFVNVAESSEDLIRIYFHDGEIYYISYGSAIGQDAVEIIEYYTLRNATFFENVSAPEDIVILKLSTDKFIALMKKAYKKVRVA
jgi:hypothetical protein